LFDDALIPSDCIRVGEIEESCFEIAEGFGLEQFISSVDEVVFFNCFFEEVSFYSF
jgi:hypothetical protein